MVAVSKGFVDMVSMLHICPLIDVNHQDKDGNTAIMIAAQAGRSEDIYSTKPHIALIQSNLINTFVLFQASSAF